MRTFAVLPVVGAILTVVLGPVVPAASASSGTSAARTACGHVDLAYAPNEIHPRDLMDMDLSIENCSDMAEHLVLRVRHSGPCPFPHPGMATYDLEAHHGFGSSALVIGPSCVGRYRVLVGLYLGGHLLDRDTAGFRVVAEG